MNPLWLILIIPVCTSVGVFAMAFFKGCEREPQMFDGRFCSDCKYALADMRSEPCELCLNNPDKPNWVKDDGEI